MPPRLAWFCLKTLTATLSAASHNVVHQRACEGDDSASRAVSEFLPARTNSLSRPTLTVHVSCVQISYITPFWTT